MQNTAFKSKFKHQLTNIEHFISLIALTTALTRWLTSVIRMSNMLHVRLIDKQNTDHAT